MTHLDPRPVALEELPGRVRRRSVDHHDLERIVAKVLQSLERPGETRAPVIRVDHDRKTHRWVSWRRTMRTRNQDSPACQGSALTVAGRRRVGRSGASNVGVIWPWFPLEPDR